MSPNTKKIAVVAAAIFAAHVVAVFALQSPRQTILARIVKNGVGRLPASQQHETPQRIDDGLNDPLIFAGAHSRGFSAPAWLTAPQNRYAISNTVAPEKYLAYARTGAELEVTNTFRPPNTALPFLAFNLPPPSPASSMMVEGELTSRPLTSQPAIPIQFGTEVLSNTVVQVGVRADGFPLSMRIVSTSGSRAADLSALDIANRLRFSSDLSRSNALQWGRLVFQWFTTEPPTTNAPAPTTALAR